VPPGKTRPQPDFIDEFVPVASNQTLLLLHGTGGNAAGNASFTDQSFVVKRFVWVGNRKMI